MPDLNYATGLQPPPTLPILGRNLGCPKLGLEAKQNRNGLNGGREVSSHYGTWDDLSGTGAAISYSRYIRFVINSLQRLSRFGTPRVSKRAMATNILLSGQSSCRHSIKLTHVPLLPRLFPQRHRPCGNPARQQREEGWKFWRTMPAICWQHCSCTAICWVSRGSWLKAASILPQTCGLWLPPALDW